MNIQKFFTALKCLNIYIRNLFLHAKKSFTEQVSSTAPFMQLPKFR